MLFFLPISCTKDQLNVTEVVIPSEVSNSSSFSSSGFLRDGEIPEATILGDLRQNPYTVAKMTEAYNIVHEQPIDEVPTTNDYVKFCPADYNELRALADLDLNLYDYPLEYEVVQMGKWYNDPAIPDDQIPCFYAIVPPNTAFEGVSYEVLEHLHLAPYNSKITEEAFKLTENTYEKTECFPFSPDYPQCFCEEQPADQYEDCMEQLSGNNTGGFNDVATCNNNFNPNYPSGSITVEDSQLGNVPVRNVKIILKDSWFTEDEVWTNDDGCFHLPKAYSNKVWMWVKFKNEKTVIRGLRGIRLWEYATAVKDYVGVVENAPYNAMDVHYSIVNDDSSTGKMYWHAAHALNSVEEFYDYAADEGILPPPEGLSILVNNFDAPASAPMFDQIIDSPLGHLTGVGLTYGAMTIAIPDVVQAVFPGLSVVPLATLPLQNYLIAFAPDIQYAYGNEVNRPTDTGIKSTMFHELAHASHYVQISEAYWLILVSAEIMHGGHGDDGDWQSDRIALVESWGGHVEHIFTHEHYETNPSINETWLELLDETLNEELNHVPVGIYVDLIDTVEPATSINQNNTQETAVTDNVSGFTNEQMYSLLTTEITSIDEFRTDLIANFLTVTPNTVVQVNNLFASY